LSTNNHTKNLPIAGFLLALFGSLLFSTKAIIVKMAFRDTVISAIPLLAMRMLFSLPFYVVAAFLVSSRKDNQKLKPGQWFFIITLGLFGYYLSSLFDFLGLQYISAGLERLILFLYPTFVLFINAIFYRQRIKTVQWIALAITYAGMMIAYIGELQLELTAPHFFLGTSLIFLCAITFAFYIAGSGRIIPVVGVTKFTAYAMLTSTTGVLLHYLFTGNSIGSLIATKTDWAYGLSLAIIATVLPSFMVSAAMKRIGSNNVAIISAVGPVSTIIQAHFILAEPIFLAQIVGTSLVIAGVLYLGWKAKKS